MNFFNFYLTEEYKLNNNTDSLSEIKACGESVRLRDAFDQEAVSMKQEENIKCSI